MIDTSGPHQVEASAYTPNGITFLKCHSKSEKEVSLRRLTDDQKSIYCRKRRVTPFEGVEQEEDRACIYREGPSLYVSN